MLIEALSNLVDNAIKFTPPGGSVRIEIADDSGVPLLRVADSGPGISVAERSGSRSVSTVRIRAGMSRAAGWA
ncbi:MAG: ATP-binding protein [Aliidongia sp.]